MKTFVRRFDSGPHDTFGKFYIENTYYCYTLEDEKRDKKVKGETRIPAGIYEIVHYNSPSHGPRSLMIKDVPGFSYVLMHPGNTEDDTDACLLVGKERGTLNGKRAVLKSKIAFNEIKPLIDAALDSGEKVTIEIIDCD